VFRKEGGKNKEKLNMIYHDHTENCKVNGKELK